MRKRKNFLTVITLILFIFTFTVIASIRPAEAAQGPLFYLVPAGGNLFIILGDTPRQVYGFRVYRKGPGEKDYTLLTEDIIAPVNDPYSAREIIDGDYDWVAGKVGTDDPVLLWQRLRGNRNLSMLLCLVSHRLRVAIGRTYLDSKVVKGKQYSYRVVFYNALGKEVMKKVKSVKITEPPPQQKAGKVRAKAGDGNVTIKWSYPKYSGSERDLTVGFHIYRKEVGKKFKRITSAPVFRVENNLYYFDETVENGKSYVYGVAPVNIVGITGDISESNPVKPVDRTPPLVPMGLVAKDTKEGVLLLWKFSPEVDFDHYNVLRANSLRGEYKRINEKPVKNPRYIDSEIVRGKIYYYKVTAVDKSGNESKPTGAVNIVPKDLTPPGPVKEITFKVDEKKRYVTLKWEPPSDPDVIGYYIYRGENKQHAVRLNGKPFLPEKKEIAFTDTGYKKAGLKAGKHLVYGISACDSSYNEGPVSYIEVDIPDNEPPHPVFSFSASVTREGWVKLVWQPSLSRDLLIHRIYRAKGKKEKFEVLAELKREVTSYTDKSADRGKEVSYCISEVDKNGNESKKSRVVTVVPTDVIPPAAPENFTVVPTGRRLVLRWSPPDDNDVLGYNIWFTKDRSGKKHWKKLNRSLITDLQIKIRNYGTGLYGVNAVDTSGNSGKRAVYNYKE